MSDFNPGPGWREVAVEMAQPEGTEVIIIGRYGDLGGPSSRWFVPVSPVPPLPNAPYTVIRVTKWLGGGRAVADLMLRPDGTWYDDTIGRTLTNPKTITSFKVLSEPGAITAKAVLGRLLNRLDAEGIRVTNIGEWIDMVGREFGVQS